MIKSIERKSGKTEWMGRWNAKRALQYEQNDGTQQSNAVQFNSVCIERLCVFMIDIWRKISCTNVVKTISIWKFNAFSLLFSLSLFLSFSLIVRTWTCEQKIPFSMRMKWIRWLKWSFWYGCNCCRDHTTNQILKWILHFFHSCILSLVL